MEIVIPADVPKDKEEEFVKNYQTATKGTGRLMLFAGDQKIEHLNSDFVGENELGPIPQDDADPEHLFRIASQATIGIFAVQYGMVSRFGRKYNKIPYLIKLNSKTNLVKVQQMDPLSRALVSVEDVVDLKKTSGLNIVGVGYTIYIGSEFEKEMIREASHIVKEAHKNGLFTVLWMYPRGKAVKDEKDSHLIAGATGVAFCLGSDFTKINAPKKEGHDPEEALKEAVVSAGATKVICAGGSSKPIPDFFKQLHRQLNVAGTSGNATGRNIHQKTLQDALRMCNAISSITYGNKDPEFALKVYKGEETFNL